MVSKHAFLAFASWVLPVMAGVGKLPQRATERDLRYQPAMDFDTDGCYAVSAIDKDQNVSPGLWTNTKDLTGDCRDPGDLQSSNAYARNRCNNGWCVYVYDYYFEKDCSGVEIKGAEGHRHDWEHIILWVKGDQSGNEPLTDRYVFTSAHGSYTRQRGDYVRWHSGSDGKPTHPKVVYHKDSGSTHAFRFANAADDAIENDTRQWFFGDLISHYGFPSVAVRDKLYNHDFGDASMAIRDNGGAFVNNIEKTRPKTLNCAVGTTCNPPQYKWDFTFDMNLDADGSPGEPPSNDPPPSNPPPSSGTRKGRMLIVGDSITHGQDGDFTWRYRLWQWLGANGHDIAFVGPSFGTHGEPDPASLKPRPPPFGGVTEANWADRTGRYEGSVDEGFTNQRHGAKWGRQAKQVRPLIKSWCSEYQPDYLLVLLGFNDLGWWVSGPEGLMDDMGNLVQNCREGKANVQILIGNVVDRSRLRGREDLVINTANYNERLRGHINNWFRWESNIAYVDVNKGYQCRIGFCPDGYDGLHPNAIGEYHIAEAFVNTLKDKFGFSGGNFNVPGSMPFKRIIDPTGLSISAVPEGFHLTWDRYGGSHPAPPRGYNIRSRIQGMTSWWSSGIVYPHGRESWQPWVLKDQVWEYQVQARGDSDATTAWTGSISAKANPDTLEGPKNIITSPRDGGIQFSWSSVSGNINRYAVYVWDQDEEGSFLNVIGASGTSAYIGGLIPGHRYGTWVATWVNLSTGPAGGLPAAGREVYPSRGGPPGPPSNVQATNTSPNSVRLTWNAVPGAAGYAIYYRNHKNNDPYVLDRNSGTNSHEVGFLFTGTWNNQFCVTAYNGDMETGFSNCVIPPVYPGFSKRDTVVRNQTDLAFNKTIRETERMMNDKGLQAIYSLVFHNETNF